MTNERMKVAPWEKFTDGEWHEVRRGPEGEAREESLRQYRRHWESLRSWTRINGKHGRLSRHDSGRVLMVQIVPRVDPDVAAHLRDKPRHELGRDLVQAITLLRYGLHLRMHGERAPGGGETWREFDTRTEAFLRRVLAPGRGGAMRRLADAREQMVHQRILSAVVSRMSGREFREWFSSSRATSGREFYEGKP